MSGQRTARIFRGVIRRNGFVAPAEKGSPRARIIRRAHRVIERKAERRAGVAAQREAWAKYERDFQQTIRVLLVALAIAREQSREAVARNIEGQIDTLISAALARGLSRGLLWRLIQALPWTDPEAGLRLWPRPQSILDLTQYYLKEKG